MKKDIFLSLELGEGGGGRRWGLSGDLQLVFFQCDWCLVDRQMLFQFIDAHGVHHVVILWLIVSHLQPENHSAVSLHLSFFFSYPSYLVEMIVYVVVQIYTWFQFFLFFCFFVSNSYHTSPYPKKKL